MCFNLFRCLSWSVGPNIGKNKQKVVDFPKKSWKFNSVALILCWDISKDFFMSYMIENDVPVWVLIFLDVYVGFQDQQLVKNKQDSKVYNRDHLQKFVAAKFLYPTICEI